MNFTHVIVKYNYSTHRMNLARKFYNIKNKKRTFGFYSIYLLTGLNDYDIIFKDKSQQ